jgi:hypothetical protein
MPNNDIGVPTQNCTTGIDGTSKADAINRLVTQHSFIKQVEARMRLKRESFEKAIQTLLVDLRDDELEARLTESERPP